MLQIKASTNVWVSFMNCQTHCDREAATNMVPTRCLKKKSRTFQDHFPGLFAHYNLESSLNGPCSSRSICALARDIILFNDFMNPFPSYSYKTTNGCFPTAWGRQPTFSDTQDFSFNHRDASILRESRLVTHYKAVVYPWECWNKFFGGGMPFLTPTNQYWEGRWPSGRADVSEPGGPGFNSLSQQPQVIAHQHWARWITA